MKPPPRTRKKPKRHSRGEPEPGKGQGQGQGPGRRSARVTRAWMRPEKVKLLNALRALARTEGDGGGGGGGGGCCGDIDYEALKKKVPTRPILEIRSFVEDLKNKVILYACLQMKKSRWQERKGKPIEVWANMASRVAGTLEESVDAAFSQMLVVASTEPRTLRNCDPPQVNRPAADAGNGPAGRTIAFRPVPCLPGQGEGPGPSQGRLCVLKTPGPTMGPAKKLQLPFKVVRVTRPSENTPPSVAVSSAAAAPVGQPEGHSAPPPVSPPTAPVQGQDTAILDSTVAAKAKPAGSPANQTLRAPPEARPTASDSALSPPESTPTTTQVPLPTSASARPPPSPAIHAKFGRTSKFATKDSPRTLGVKCIVDFERIYRYLSAIPKPNDQCQLTPMESAIMLDLLMSLPEELPLLDCNSLQKHLKETYQSLSSPANSKTARDTCADPPGPSSLAAPSGQGGGEGYPAAEAAAATGQLAPSTLRPPLNPFVVPLKLLKRK